MATDVLTAAVKSKETLIGRVKGVQKNFKVLGVKGDQVSLEITNPWPAGDSYRQTVNYSDIDFADSTVEATLKDGKWFASSDLEEAPKRTRSRSTKTTAKK